MPDPSDSEVPPPKRRAAVSPIRKKYGDALGHIVRTVRTILKEEDLHLGDGPTQDLISTLYIDFARRKTIDYDFTEGPR